MILIKNRILETLEKTLDRLNIGYDPLLIEHPEEEIYGDYASNVALVSAKGLKLSPMKIAKQIVDHFPETDLIEKVEIVKPGFINFFLKKDFLLKVIREVIAFNTKFGSDNIGRKKKVVLEHTNVNPNKALHIGHLRNACLGNSVEKILEFLGYDVEVQYYVDDTGVQVAGTLLALTELGAKPKKGEKYDHFASRAYVEAMENLKENPGLEAKQTEIIHDLDKQKGRFADLAKKMTIQIVYDNLKTMHDFDIDYDLLVWESDILASGFWEKAFEVLKKGKTFVKINSGKYGGCWIIKKVLGSDKVIIKSNGVVTYTGKDIAYHLWKFNLLGKDFLYKVWPNKIQAKRLWTTSQDGKVSDKLGKANFVINFIDVRQTFPQQVVKKSLERLGYKKQSENLIHIGYGVVSLSPETAKELGVDVSDKKSQYTMSGREGIGVLTDDLLGLVEKRVKTNHPESPASHEAAVGAIKYYMLSYNPYSDVVFDYKQALNIYGNTGPYLQYTYARCKSVLRKAKKANQIVDLKQNYNDFKLEEVAILRWIYRFPEVVQEAGDQYTPHLICDFLFELARRFNTFYNKHQILSSGRNPQTSNFRLLLTAAVGQTMKNGLDLLGIKAPEEI